MKTNPDYASVIRNFYQEFLKWKVTFIKSQSQAELKELKNRIK